MHRERPLVTESPDELKALLNHETQRQKRQRLHALYLFASDQATTRQAVAQLLGLHRETIGRWMACYATGGLGALLNIYVAAGKPPALPAPVLADLEQQLRRPEGFASHEAIRVWLLQTHQITINGKTLQKLIRRCFGAKSKVARPSDIKNADAAATFLATVEEQLQAAIPVSNRLPLQVFAQDESRLGLHTIRRREW